MTQPAASFGFKDVDPADKPGLVRGVFDRVARRYDLMNDLMSAGVHRVWKDMTAARLNPRPGETIVDCAGGTGDMAMRFARLARKAQLRHGGDDARIFVVDYNAEMIAAGRERGRRRPRSPGASATPRGCRCPDACADALCDLRSAFATWPTFSAALREARRVLKVGGRFLCLEFSRPVTEPLQKAYDAYSFKVIPQVGEWVAGDREAYQYLVGRASAGFLDQARFAQMMREAGFDQVGWTNFTGGVAALHQGWALKAPATRPATRPPATRKG